MNGSFFAAGIGIGGLVTAGAIYLYARRRAPHAVQVALRAEFRSQLGAEGEVLFRALSPAIDRIARTVIAEVLP